MRYPALSELFKILVTNLYQAFTFLLIVLASGSSVLPRLIIATARNAASKLCKDSLLK